MISVLRIPAVHVDAGAIHAAGWIALVDAQPEFFKEVRLPRVDAVFDHHPNKTRTRVRFCDICPACLSTSSILAGYLAAQGIQPTRRLATALYYGIQTDARNMQRWPTPQDNGAMLFLQKRASISLLRLIEVSQYSLGRLDYFSIALVKLRYARHVLFSHIGPVPSADVCVQIADFLVRIKEARWALVSGVAGDRLVIVFRCDGHLKHAGRTAAAAFGGLGSAGGHKTMSRAEIPGRNLPAGVTLTGNEGIERFVLASLARVEREFRPLLKALPE